VNTGFNAMQPAISSRGRAKAWEDGLPECLQGLLDRQRPSPVDMQRHWLGVAELQEQKGRTRGRTPTAPHWKCPVAGPERTPERCGQRPMFAGGHRLDVSGEGKRLILYGAARASARSRAFAILGREGDAPAEAPQHGGLH